MDIAGIDALRIVLDPIGQTGIALALMLVMFSVALGLSARDFALLVRRPALFAGGVLTQVIGLPLLTYGLVHVVAVPASIALGMFVVACCPGGASSNLLTYLARGHVAYSVSLTAVSSVLAAVVTPVSILFWSQAYAPTRDLLDTVDVSPLVFLGQTTALLAVPLAAGMLIAARAPDVAARIRRYTALAGASVLGGVIVYGTVYFWSTLVGYLPYLITVAVLHNAAAFALGNAVALGMRAERTVRRALTFEIGIQNSGLALVILVGQLKGLGGAAAIAAVWGVWHLVAGGLIVVALRGFDGRRARDAA